MIVMEHSITTPATPYAVWQVWSDVDGWPSWDRDVASCKLSGPFQEGAEAVLKPTSGPKVNIKIINCIVQKSFVTEGSLPCWTSLIFEHELKEVKDGVEITHRVILKGCLSGLFNWILGKSIREGLPVALKQLAGRAEKIKAE